VCRDEVPSFEKPPRAVGAYAFASRRADRARTRPQLSVRTLSHHIDAAFHAVWLSASVANPSLRPYRILHYLKNSLWFSLGALLLCELPMMVQQRLAVRAFLRHAHTGGTCTNFAMHCLNWAAYGSARMYRAIEGARRIQGEAVDSVSAM